MINWSEFCPFWTWAPLAFREGRLTARRYPRECEDFRDDANPLLWRLILLDEKPPRPMCGWDRGARGPWGWQSDKAANAGAVITHFVYDLWEHRHGDAVELGGKMVTPYWREPEPMVSAHHVAELDGESAIMALMLAGETYAIDDINETIKPYIRVMPWGTNELNRST